ncbi:hypothetical protein F4810DRAFT_723321 [Camillea tinctor]|nr:hypothetical protein F4810DRAFT_723321 [Camillea tinctor]
MDWARDGVGLNKDDLKRVFKPETRVFNDGNWKDSLLEMVPSPNESGPGLVMIIADRTSEEITTRARQAHINLEISEPSDRSCTEKSMGSTLTNQSTVNPTSTATGGRREIRVLPFSQATFQVVTQMFWTHPSISRVISRADIPLFSATEVKLEIANFIYNYKTTNAWAFDLAFTATFFPQTGITYAILFGCPENMKNEIIGRLSSAMNDSAHPLLVPGILVEIERIRHIKVVDETITELENRISELDVLANMSGVADPDTERKNQLKREAWLNTGYLRNQLVTWKNQLSKMLAHMNELEDQVFRPEPSCVSLRCSSKGHSKKQCCLRDTEENGDSIWRKDKDPETSVDNHIRWTGNKIKGRLRDIIEEYDEKIRDCTMRLDGMTMATQWAQGETNVEIALATSRDSRHMRSIAILSMVFLPGTAIASIFSTSLFQWDDPSGNVIVSKYLWIYFAVTIPCTIMTVGFWYYFSLYRPSKKNELV